MNHYNKYTAFVLTFLFPFAGLVYSLAHWREKWAKNAFWLACVYFGAVLIYCPEGSILGAGGDGGRYVLRLMDMYNNSSITLGSILSLYQNNPRYLDLYQQLMTFFVSRFTDNGHVLFAVFAFVYGFFYSRNIWYILERLPNKRLGWVVILVALYFLICPITQINGVRMWTALHVYVYGMMPFLLERDKSKIWWTLITPLIHFSFLSVALFGLLWFFLPIRIKTNSSTLLVALVIFIVSIFVNTINMDMVGGMVEEYAPESVDEHLEGYMSEEYIARQADANLLKNWYVGISGSILSWSYNILLILLLPCIKRYFNNDSGILHMYTFALFLGSIANLMSLIPSGGRFQLLSQMFKVPLIILVAMSVSLRSGFRRAVNYSLILLILPLVLEIRKLFDYFSITAILGNFITTLFWENNVPLIDLIKRII